MEENNIIMCHLHPLNETCVSFKRNGLRLIQQRLASGNCSDARMKLAFGKNANTAFNKRTKLRFDLIGVDLKCIKCSMERITALKIESELGETRI